MMGSSALPYPAQAVALIGGLRRVWGCILLPEATSIQCTLSQLRLLHAGISFQALPLCLLQVPAFAGTDDHISTLAGCIVCLVTLAAYCIFQVRPPPEPLGATIMADELPNHCRCSCHSDITGCLPGNVYYMLPRSQMRMSQQPA